MEMQAGLSRKAEFLRGIADEAPLLLGVAPFGSLMGALAIRNGLTLLQTQSTSFVIFAGSAQFIAVQLIGAGASFLVILMVVAVVNLRHALYSASVAPYIAHLRPAWKYLLAYLLTDEAYAVVITNYEKHGNSPNRHWYFFGAGLTLWAGWNLSTLAGILIGGQIGADVPVGFFLPLVFIALVVPGLRDRANVLAAVVAGAIGLLAAGLPLKIGLMIAALIGILTGMLVERRQQ